jgi:hypothetical protein
MVITSPTSGRKLEITNLIKFEPAKNPDFWNASELTIRIQSRKSTKNMPQPLKATVKYKNADGQEIDIPIGTISMKSIKEHDLKPGMSVKQGKVEFYFGISDGMIDALKQQTKEYLESIRNNTPEAEKLQLAAAIHHVTHTEESKKYLGVRRASIAFALFPDEVISQLQQLQFTEMRVIGTQFNECALRNFRGEKVPIKFENGPNPREECKTARWVTVEGKKLGTIDARSPHLLAGCEALATVTSSPSTSVVITSLKNPNNKLQIDSVNKYAFVGRQWQGEKTNITIDVQQTDQHKAPTVFAKVGNQILGVLNKQSVNFLQQRLAAVGRQIHGFTFVGTVNNAPASYADIVLDPTTVQYSDIQIGKQQVAQNLVEEQVVVVSPKEKEEVKSAVATVVFFEAPVEQALQAKTEMVMCNMVKRAVDRAVERGYDTVQFVNASPYKEENFSPAVVTIQQLARSRHDIKIELSAAASVKSAMQQMKQPNDIVIGVSSTETAGIIDYATLQGKAVAAYVPETGGFDRRNLSERGTATQKTVSTTKKDLEQEL